MLYNLYLEAKKKVKKEMSGDGGVAGFQAPQYTKRQNLPIHEEDNIKQFDGQDDERTFEGKKFTITSEFRGPSKGQTLMIKENRPDGKTFSNDAIVQKILNFIEKSFS